MAEIFCKKTLMEIMPATRAVIAEKLHEMDASQSYISKKLGTTQPAVSQYLKGARGRIADEMIKNKRMSKFIEEVVKNMEDESYDLNSHTCEICREARENKVVDVPKGKDFLCPIELMEKKHGKQD
ncbi:MAG: transcriptional regulator [Candidatus Acidifodinimicrobium sp.]